MRCAVFNCSRNNKKDNKSRFFKFPKDKILLKKWIKFCQREDHINTKTSCICDAHFTPANFERNLQYEMGLCSRNPTKLRPDAFPTVDPKSVDSDLDELDELDEQEKQMQARKTKEMVESLLAAYEPPISENDATIEKLRRETDQLKKALAKSDNKINRLNIALKKAEFQRDNMEAKLKNIFTEGQIKKLKNGLKRKTWKEEDIARSNTLYATSAKAYKLLLDKNFPLPSIRTLQRWEKNKVDISSGLLEPVVKIEIEKLEFENIEMENIEIEKIEIEEIEYL